MIIRLKGINKVRGRDGKIRCYDRITGLPIQAEYGTDAFVQEVLAARKKFDEEKAEKAKVPNTWGWLVVYYKSTSKWSNLGKRTKEDYQDVLNYMANLDKMPLAEMQPEWVAEFVELTYGKRKRRFANYVLAVISRIWNVGRAAGKCPHPNPTDREHKISKPRGEPKRNRAWKADEVASYFGVASRQLTIAAALALMAGWREGDVCVLPRRSYDGESIMGRQGKTDNLVWIKAMAMLRAIIDAEIKRLPRLPDAPLVINARGSGFTESGLRASFFKVIRKLEQEGKVQPGLTFHGLRTTLATWIADAGGDTRDIAAALGHATEAMAIYYAREADQKRRAAYAIDLVEQSANEILQNIRTDFAKQSG
ncbi:tyrosine-type recombinase/integrase [Telmatospirillum sp.]|uniref:tyrosine-type recombinase/integrase n=1 Tax=Telmatospirillum sp. TaxID=2079197 RepID=UPI00284E70D6|nr:tyrosine-type recombinase/integrase [Telmatospirillum sp.]MDR3438998.1 tyrosine-type recombinase/integrase [Telmatospirillum sp.]